MNDVINKLIGEATEDIYGVQIVDPRRLVLLTMQECIQAFQQGECVKQHFGVDHNE